MLWTGLAFGLVWFPFMVVDVDGGWRLLVLLDTGGVFSPLLSEAMLDVDVDGNWDLLELKCCSNL